VSEIMFFYTVAEIPVHLNWKYSFNVIASMYQFRYCLACGAGDDRMVITTQRFVAVLLGVNNDAHPRVHFF